MKILVLYSGILIEFLWYNLIYHLSEGKAAASIKEPLITCSLNTYLYLLCVSQEGILSLSGCEICPMKTYASLG